MLPMVLDNFRLQLGREASLPGSFQPNKCMSVGRRFLGDPSLPQASAGSDTPSAQHIPRFSLLTWLT